LRQQGADEGFLLRLAGAATPHPSRFARHLLPQGEKEELLCRTGVPKDRKHETNFNLSAGILTIVATILQAAARVLRSFCMFARFAEKAMALFIVGIIILGFFGPWLISLFLAALCAGCWYACRPQQGDDRDVIAPLSLNRLDF